MSLCGGSLKMSKSSVLCKTDPFLRSYHYRLETMLLLLFPNAKLKVTAFVQLSDINDWY